MKTVGQFNQVTREERYNQRMGMMEMYSKGISFRKIAEHYGCHETNAGQIIKRELQKRGEKYVARKAKNTVVRDREQRTQESNGQDGSNAKFD